MSKKNTTKKSSKKAEKAIVENAIKADATIMKNSLLKYGSKNTLNHGIKSLGGCCDTVALTSGNKPFTMEDLIAEAVKQGHATITRSRVIDHYNHVNGVHTDKYTISMNGEKFIADIKK